MFFLFVVLIACIAGIATASPIEVRGIHCEPNGSPARLLTHTESTGQTYYYHTQKKGNEIALVRGNSTNEQFQFYKCSPPSSKYRKSDYKGTYGQLRSTKHAGLCVTAGNYWQQTNSKESDKPSFTKKPSNHGKITLEPCATGATDVMRRQWMGTGDLGLETKGCHVLSVFQTSEKQDEYLEALFGDSESSHFSFVDLSQFKEKKQPMAYLNDNFPVQCKDN